MVLGLPIYVAQFKKACNCAGFLTAFFEEEKTANLNNE